MARPRSRSRRTRRPSAEVVPHVGDHRGFNYGLFLRRWHSSLPHAPVSLGGRVHIELVKPEAQLAGSAWVRLGDARGLRFATGATFGVDFSLLVGESLEAKRPVGSFHLCDHVKNLRSTAGRGAWKKLRNLHR